MEQDVEQDMELHVEQDKDVELHVEQYEEVEAQAQLRRVQWIPTRTPAHHQPLLSIPPHLPLGHLGHLGHPYGKPSHQTHCHLWPQGPTFACRHSRRLSLLL